MQSRLSALAIRSVISGERNLVMGETRVMAHLPFSHPRQLNDFRKPTT
jgi:hypothetical protein